MGLLQRIRQRRNQIHPAHLHRAVQPAAPWLRLCRFEQMEPRQLLAVSVLPIQVGAVYYEDAGGDDLVADRFEVTFIGGAVGTQLTELVIETDKNDNGVLDNGDCFFDTEPGGRGVYGAIGFEILENDGFEVLGIEVEDGGDTLRIMLAGFEQGEKLVFSVDVDEQGPLSTSASSHAEGDEFQVSRLRATFEADHYLTASDADMFLDFYDEKLAETNLDLPPDDYVLPPEESLADRTAGAVFSIVQVPLPITLSGYVFHDLNANNVRDPGESGIGGVTVTLREWTGTGFVDTVKTTDSINGYYAFDGLLPGEYEILETQPAGYLSVGATAGTVGGEVRGFVLDSDTIIGVDLEGGDNSIHNDFAEVRPASLSGHVYHDANDDGVFDQVNEDGIGGAAVTVAGEGITVTVATDKDGFWHVDNLYPGEYQVTEVTPDGYLDGKDRAPDGGGIAHNPGDLITDVNLAAGQNGENYDFGELLPGGLCGYVYIDVNNNGLRDPGEDGIGGVEVVLLTADGTPIDTIWTDETGHYCFHDLVPDTYGIMEIHPDAYVDGTDKEGTLGGVPHNPGDLIDLIVVGSDQRGMENNFGERERVGISGYVYEDNNQNGVKDDEPGIGGVVLRLLDENGNPTDQTTTTDKHGYYEFIGLAPGTYGVAETQPTGYHDGLDKEGDAGGEAHNPGDSITGAELDGGIVAKNYNFGELQPARLQGTVFVDLDGDLMPGEGEIRIPGVTVYLLDETGQRIASATTDKNGEYRFDDLRPGTYGLEEIQPAAYVDGDEKVGTADGVLDGNDRMAKIVLAPGVKGVDYNFCEMLYGSISGYVFQDGPTIRLLWFEEIPDVTTMRDGQFTADDTPLAGVVLQLRDASGMALVDSVGKPITTVTNANGYYEFTNLAPGVYSVYEVHPQGYVDGIDTAGSLGGIAVNPHELEGLPPLGLLTDPKDDAVVQIVVGPGVNGISYNFSEVRVENEPFYIPPDRPQPDPAPPQPIPPGYPVASPAIHTPPVKITYELPPLYGGMGVPLTYTWHLSVINAGQPRRLRESADEVAVQGTLLFNPVSWDGSPLRDGQWTVADNDGRVEYNFQFGVTEGIPVVGDFNGDGTDEIGVFVAGEWFLDLNGNGVWDEGDLWAKLGDADDLPVTGDWDGDGKTDIGIFGKSWVGDPRALQAEAGLPDRQNEPNGGYKNLPPDPQQATDQVRTLKRSAEGRLRADLIDHVFQFGHDGDRPVAGDWNGDGVSSIGIYRDGDWFLDVDGNGRWSDPDLYFEFGQRGDRPVVGDFNHDGIDEVGVYRDGQWHLDINGNHQLDAQDKVFTLGGPGDVPVVGDFDGDGTDQVGVYHGGPTPDRQASAE
ncbi:MAG: hypothetical protein JW719_00180 [Pirellulales bacterium]|nr:hypothetical protein [Pirellulales bacterium]